MITDVFVPALFGIDVNDVSFQQIDAQLATHLMPESIYCVKRLMKF